MKLILSVAVLAGAIICGTAHAANYCHWRGSEGGTLELDNGDEVDVVVNGRLMGAGTLKLAGRGTVTLDQDPALFYDDGGTLDYDSSDYRMKRPNGSLVFKPKAGMMLLVR